MLACTSGRRGVIGCIVATWLCPVREKVRPARPGVGVSVKKFAMRGQNTPNWVILGEQGEFCPGSGPVRFLSGEFCPAVARRGSCWASFVSAQRRSQMSCAEGAAEGAHGECAYMRSQSLRAPLISWGPISHAIPLSVFQVRNSNR